MSFIVSKLTENMKKVLNGTFPNYKGRKFKVIEDKFPQSLDSYWDGGSRTYYSFFDIKTEKVVNLGSNHPFFEKEKPRHLGGALLNGVVLVSNSIFLGKDTGITFYVNKGDDYEWLVGKKEIATDELNRNQKIVLVYTRGYKSSYAGVKDNRYVEAFRSHQISKDDWYEAKNGLVQIMLLNRGGQGPVRVNTAFFMVAAKHLN
mgnify:FL=1